MRTEKEKENRSCRNRDCDMAKKKEPVGKWRSPACVKSRVDVCRWHGWALPCQGPWCLKHIRMAKPSLPGLDSKRGQSFLRMQVWVLIVCFKKMFTIDFSPWCLQPEHCSPTENVPTKISKTCLLIQPYLITLPPCFSVWITPPSSPTACWVPGCCGFFIWEPRPPNISFQCPCICESEVLSLTCHPVKAIPEAMQDASVNCLLKAALLNRHNPTCLLNSSGPGSS